MKQTTSNYQFYDTYHIGIDVHKSNWKISVRFDGRELRHTSIDPSAQKLRQFVDRHFGAGRFLTVYEAGFSGFSTHRALQAEGFENIVIHAGDVPTSDKERRKKTDKVDCRKLARSLAIYDRNDGDDRLTPLFVPSEHGEAFRDLWRIRGQIVKDRTRVKNQIWSFLDKWGVELPDSWQLPRWSQTFLRYLRRQLNLSSSALQLNLEQLLDRYEDITGQLKQCEDRLTEQLQDGGGGPIVAAMQSQLPGVGRLTAMGFYAEILDIHRFSNTDKLARFLGLAPDIRQSDTSHYTTGVTNRCNDRLRRLLIESAWVAIRKDDYLHQCWRHYIRRMSKQKAIIRIARKLGERLRRIWVDQLADYAAAA